MKEIFIDLLVGLLGVIAHSVFKYNSLKSKANAGNVKFSFYVYATEDFPSIIGSISAVFLWVFLYQEFAPKNEWLDSHKLTSYAAVGFCGSYIIQYFGSRADKKITQIIDRKTSLLDETEQSNTNINSKIP